MIECLLSRLGLCDSLPEHPINFLKKKTGNVPSAHLTGWLSVSNTLMGVKKSLSTLKLACLCLSSDTEFQQDFAFKRANYLNKGVSVCRILRTLH